MRLSRRSFLALSAATVAACAGDEAADDTTAPGSSEAPSTTETPTTTASTVPPTTTVPPTSAPTSSAPSTELAADPFTLVVASGDPDQGSVVLWTRLSGPLPDDGIDVDWEIVDDGGALLAAGTARTDQAMGGAVHVVAAIPGPGEFVFRAGGFESTVGRTGPIGETDEFRIAAASCQNYEAGHYAAYRDLAGWGPDLVVFLGDFIYEGAAGAPQAVRLHEGPEPTDLTGYRARYATYLSDPQLQAARAACPWLVVWDDHEVENNYAGLVSQDDADPEQFARRRQMAYRAWWEHTPTRLPPPGDVGTDYPIHRGIDVGELVRISALDGRQHRSDQVCEATLELGAPCAGWDDPDRTMLGADQEAWIADRFATSTARWNCLAQQTVLSDLRFPGTGAILNYDQWDGYHPARERLLATAPPDLVTLTGDIHLSGVGTLTAGDAPVGVEFVTTAISSRANVEPSLQPVVAALPNIVDAELVSRGYTRHTVTPDRWTAEYRAVDDVTDADSDVSTWKTFTVDRGSTTVTADG
ncbi:MAG: alkaline phosphatase D family protein [Ilumatobacteraceae bacterium]